MRSRIASRRLTILIYRSFFLCALSFGFVSAAAAFCPRTKIFVNTEFFKSRFVVIGTVVSERTTNDADGFLVASRYRIQVEKTYRGPLRSNLWIVSENDSGRSPMKPGQKFLLFVRTFERHLVIDNCGNSQLLSDARDVIEAIRQIAKAGPYGEIDARVRSRNQDVSGIRFVARSGRKTFSAVTGEGGWAHFRVPPGEYRLTARSSKFWVTPYDLNEDTPAHFAVHRGGCVQLDFDASPR